MQWLHQQGWIAAKFSYQSVRLSCLGAAYRKLQQKPKTFPELKDAVQHIWTALLQKSTAESVKDFHKRLKASVSATHTRNHFTALWTLSGTTHLSQYQKVHFVIFWIFRCKMKITRADTPTIWMDCHPFRLNGALISAIPTIFMPDSLPGTTLSIYFGLGQAPNMLACIPGGLVSVTANGGHFEHKNWSLT